MIETNKTIAQLKLELDILKILNQSTKPIGAVYLSMTLSKKHNLAQASLGRKLLSLDYEGFTKKITKVGRVITQKGIEYIHYLNDFIILEESKEDFFGTLLASKPHELLDLLILKRGLEKEAAFLAAQNASEEIIQNMEQVLDSQLTEISMNKSGLKQDFQFHKLVSLASNNKILVKTITVIRNRINLLRQYSTTRKTIGGSLYEDHVKILTGIRERNPQKAALAMEQHANKMIAEMNLVDSKKGGGGITS